MSSIRRDQTPPEAHPRSGREQRLAAIRRLLLLACLLAPTLVCAQTRGIDANYDHGCALAPNGGVVCWGSNAYGQLGIGSFGGEMAAVPVVGIDSAVGVAVGIFHSCALLADGTVKCWGYNYFGQLGNGASGSQGMPVPVSGLDNVVGLEAGGSHSCAVLESGEIKCWGKGGSGELGYGGTAHRPLPTLVSGIAEAVSVSAGTDHTCALLAGGSLRCWGGNGSGKLGNNSNTSSPVPTPVMGIVSATSVTAGGSHSCATLADATARCWGNNSRGQLGVNNGNDGSWVPVVVQGLQGAVQIEAGGSHSCTRLGTGSVSCWGSNDYGQLGNGSHVASPVTLPVDDLTGVEAIATGNNYSCSRMGDGSTRCWGDNFRGQLGTGQVGISPRDLDVLGMHDATMLGAGFEHACAVDAAARVWCWGRSGAGQLGNGSVVHSRIPVPASLSVDVAELATGSVHNCALTAQGAVWCWGSNHLGQLGNYTPAISALPVAVLGVSDASAVAAGSNHHSCAVVTDGRIKCWGNNQYGALGNGTTSSFPTYQPVDVANLVGAIDVVTGAGHTCALMASGTAKCWGSNYSGELGMGLTGPRPLVPFDVVQLSGVTALAAGRNHTCALLEDGSVRCWGANHDGQLGRGTSGDSGFAIPAPVPGLEGVASLMAGYSHNCAVLATGVVKCWGSNQYGQLGLGDTATRTSPVEVPGIVGVLRMAGGRAHTCADLADGPTKCWGDNSFGQLGAGSAGHSTRPVAVLAAIDQHTGIRVEITRNPEPAAPGTAPGPELRAYRVRIENLGPSAANDVDLEVLEPDALVAIQWLCAAGTAPCSPESGEGAVQTRFSLAAGQQAVVEMVGEIRDSVPWLALYASATLPASSAPSVVAGGSGSFEEPGGITRIFVDGFDKLPVP